MTNLICLYIIQFNMALYSLFCSFLLYLSAKINCDFWVSPSEFYSRRFSPSWSCLLAHFNSFFALSLLSIPVVFRNFRNSATVFLFPGRLDNHLLSICDCHITPCFSNLNISIFLYFFYFRHQAYICSTIYSVALHHQHFGVSITPILTRNITITPCQTFS